MSEEKQQGKLKQEIRLQIHYLRNPLLLERDYEEADSKLIAVLDEVKADFPWYVLCNIGHPMFEGDKKALETWFKKNFGEPKKSEVT